jgi:hypothetical protein
MNVFNFVPANGCGVCACAVVAAFDEAAADHAALDNGESSMLPAMSAVPAVLAIFFINPSPFAIIVIYLDEQMGKKLLVHTQFR